MKIFKKINLKGISLLLLMSLLLCIIPSDNIFADETQYKVVYDDDGNRLYEFWDEESETYSYVNADIYINCDIEVWLNFYAKFKERLRIL